MMKAKVCGIKLEGTPAEIAEVIKLAGFAKQAQGVIRYIPTYPVQQCPTYPVQSWWGYGTGVTTCEATLTTLTAGGTVSSGSDRTSNVTTTSAKVPFTYTN